MLVKAVKACSGNETWTPTLLRASLFEVCGAACSLHGCQRMKDEGTGETEGWRRTEVNTPGRNMLGGTSGQDGG